jgi:hypothetical protein
MDKIFENVRKIVSEELPYLVDLVESKNGYFLYIRSISGNIKNVINLTLLYKATLSLNTELLADLCIRTIKG